MSKGVECTLLWHYDYLLCFYYLQIPCAHTAYTD